jgi:hypothetical protein
VAGLKPVEIKPAHVFIGLVIFWGIWLYSEYEEREQRVRFQHVFDEFHDKGARFTKEDGAVLQSEIDRLERILIALAKQEAVEHGRVLDLQPTQE